MTRRLRDELARTMNMYSLWVIVGLAVTPVFCTFIWAHSAAALSPLGVVQNVLHPVTQLILPLAPSSTGGNVPVPASSPPAKQAPVGTSSSSPTTQTSYNPLSVEAPPTSGTSLAVSEPTPAPLEALPMVAVVGLHQVNIHATPSDETPVSYEAVVASSANGGVIKADGASWEVMSVRWYWWVAGISCILVVARVGLAKHSKRTKHLVS